MSPQPKKFLQAHVMSESGSDRAEKTGLINSLMGSRVEPAEDKNNFGDLSCSRANRVLWFIKGKKYGVSFPHEKQTTDE
jgi:hypothetical protein